MENMRNLSFSREYTEASDFNIKLSKNNLLYIYMNMEPGIALGGEMQKQKNPATLCNIHSILLRFWVKQQ